MAKTKKPLEEGSVHRAKTWEIGFYALNNTSTNTYMMAVATIAYFLSGVVGLSTVLAGSIVTIMRIWDGVTDPFVGMIVDKTETKFGKNRPFIVIGQVILFSMTWLMFNIIPNLPTSARFPVFIVLYLIYIVGYTCQCVVTKSAQTCLTNDPEQRPVFAMFDTVYNILLFSVINTMIVTDYLVPKYTLRPDTDAEAISAIVANAPWLQAVVDNTNGILNGMYNPGYYKELQLIYGAIAAVFAVLAIIGLSRKDRKKYFGLGTDQKIGFKDYADTLAHNRAIQMLVVSASTDKLFSSMKSNNAITAVLFGVIMGNYAMNASFSQITAVPIVIVSLIIFNKVARKMGQKSAMMFGTYGGIIGSVVIGLMLILTNPAGNAEVYKMPGFRLLQPQTWLLLFQPSQWTILGLLFVVLIVAWQGVGNVSGNIVITMTADCADYEVYRTGKYVPGLMGTLFSFIDKLISSLASTLVAFVFAAVGYANALPSNDSPYSSGLFWATLFCYFGAPIIGWLFNVVAMKFYPLTKEKMEEIQSEIARIKAENAQKA